NVLSDVLTAQAVVDRARSPKTAGSPTNQRLLVAVSADLHRDDAYAELPIGVCDFCEIVAPTAYVGGDFKHRNLPIRTPLSTLPSPVTTPEGHSAVAEQPCRRNG